MNILINTPALTLNSGGVANHYYGLRPYWTENVKYNVVGKRNAQSGGGKYWLFWDLFKFFFLLIFWRPDVIVLNPSMAPNALKRDFIFLRVSKLLHKRVTLFIHGFHPEYCETIDTHRIATKMNAADGIFVLSASYKVTLERWGIKCPIMTTTTKVDDKLLVGFDIQVRKGKVKNILFLSRVEKEKGIYEAIEAFRLLQKDHPDLTLTVVGQGTELEAAQQYVILNNIDHLSFTGRLQGDDLVSAFKSADLYCFPSYSEGMPTSVLEAMAFGLPVVTRNVGGLTDFYEQGAMGFITDSYSPTVFAQAIAELIQDSATTQKISFYNHKYAASHFMASKVAVRFEEDLKQIIKQKHYA